MNDDWMADQMAAMQRIAPVLDSLEEAINRQGSVNLMQAYMIALRALQEVDMDKHRLEQFVAVLMADRTHHAVL